MKQLFLASATILTLSIPAVAMDNQAQRQSSGKMQEQSQSQNQTRPQQSQLNSQYEKTGPQGQTNAGQQAQMVDPSSLSEGEIRQIQMNLNKAGFAASSVDGVWGSETRSALRNYQQMNNLPGNGELNRQTLSALGVGQSNNATAATSKGGQDEHQTTGAASGSKSANPAQSAEQGKSPEHNKR